MAKVDYKMSIPALLIDLASRMYVYDSETIPGVHYAVDEDSVYVITPTQAFNIYKENVPAFIQELRLALEVS